MKNVFYACLVFVWGICFSGSAGAQQAVHTSSETTLREAERTPAEITVVDNRIKVTNAPVGSKLEIYSVVGIKVMEIEMKKSSGEYPVNIAKGYYIIRIDETVRKIAIR